MTTQKVVFITGASSGIGYETALRFARQGYDVAGTARKLERLEALEQEIKALASGRFLPLAVDVQDRLSVAAAVRQTVNVFGHIDVLVANAGVGHKGSIVDAEWDDVEALLRTNIDGVLHSIRAVVPVMREHGTGHIVLISSVVYNMVVPYAAYYAASKAFVSSIGRSLRLELEADHIQVTDMIIGRTATNFDKNRLGGQRTGQNIPSMQPEQVADGIFKAVTHQKQTVTLRLFDRLVILGNKFVPNLIGRRALKQYR